MLAVHPVNTKATPNFAMHTWYKPPSPTGVVFFGLVPGTTLPLTEEETNLLR